MIRYVLILIGCLFGFTGGLFTVAQDDTAPVGVAAYFSVEESVFALEGVIPLQLTVTLPEGFIWADDEVDFSLWDAWELVAYSEISETALPDGSTQYEQRFHVYAPEIGLHQTPEATIRYRSVVDGAEYTLSIDSTMVTVIAGQVAFLAEEADLLIGQPVILRLVAGLPLGAELTEWPTFDETWGPFMLREVSEATAQQGTDGRITYTQTFTALLWETGEHITPETDIRFMVDGVNTAVSVSPFYFNVLSVLDGTDEQLRPLKAPIDLTYVPLWLVVIVSLLLIGLAFFGGRIIPSSLILRRTGYAEDEMPLSPLQAALAKLQRAGGQQITPIETYAYVVDVLRDYLDSRFTLNAQDMTTLEIIHNLPDQLPVSLAQDLQRLLHQADLVKFARYTPDKAAAERYISFAQRWVVSAEKHSPADEGDTP